MTDNLRQNAKRTLRRYIKSTYNKTIRSYLPRKYGVYAGVTTRDPKLFDLTDRRPDYKLGVITAIHDVVAEGETVTLVGGGRGVTTVHCVKASASLVNVYEAADQMIDSIRETIEIADVDSSVSINQALVGDAINVYGDYSDSVVTQPSDLPESDILLLDCEGAEITILEGISDIYDRIIVETHPNYNAPTSKVSSILSSMGYQVERRSYSTHSSSKHVLIGYKNS